MQLHKYYYKTTNFGRLMVNTYSIYKMNIRTDCLIWWNKGNIVCLSTGCIEVAVIRNLWELYLPCRVSYIIDTLKFSWCDEKVSQFCSCRQTPKDLLNWFCKGGQWITHALCAACHWSDSNKALSVTVWGFHMTQVYSRSECI